MIRTIVDIIANYIFLKVYKRLDRITSATAYSDLHALFLLAKKGWGNGVILEIGAYHGKSTIALALGSAVSDGEEVISIDPHAYETSKIFMDNIRVMGVAERVRPIFKTSEEARKNFDKPIRLLFIDGDHAYESVKKDIMLWNDLVIDGGVIVFHDLNWESVFKAIDELIIHSREFIVERTTGCSLMVSKLTSRNDSVFEEIRVFNRLKRFIRHGFRLNAGETDCIKRYTEK